MVIGDLWRLGFKDDVAHATELKRIVMGADSRDTRWEPANLGNPGSLGMVGEVLFGGM